MANTEPILPMGSLPPMGVPRVVYGLAFLTYG